MLSKKEFSFIKHQKTFKQYYCLNHIVLRLHFNITIVPITYFINSPSIETSNNTSSKCPIIPDIRSGQIRLQNEQI